MDARVEAGHDTAFVASSNGISVNLLFSQRFAVPWVWFSGPGSGPWSLFSFFPNEGNGAPGGAGRFAKPP